MQLESLLLLENSFDEVDGPRLASLQKRIEETEQNLKVSIICQLRKFYTDMLMYIYIHVENCQ